MRDPVQALKDGRPLTEEESAAFRARLLQNAPGQTVALWVRIQRAKCQQDASRYRTLIEPDTGKVEHDMGACIHWPRAA